MTSLLLRFLSLLVGWWVVLLLLLFLGYVRNWIAVGGRWRLKLSGLYMSSQVDGGGIMVVVDECHYLIRNP